MAAKNYFRDSLNRSDYYGQDGHSPGVWFGEGARRLGLAGDVSQADFFALADNKDPQTGNRLSVRDKENRRPGYDFVFSPPKSVSAAWARGDERILEAFRQSVLDTLREDIEPEMKTRLRRNGQDGDVATGNLVGALFLHTETRPGEDLKPDAHIHIHAYIMNQTFAEHEKRWQAAQLYDLHLDRPYLEAAFEARLAKRLEELGLATERRAAGWELAGVPQSVIDKFSRRTAEVEAEAKRRGITDAAKKAELGGKTRRRKQEGLSQAELHSYWNGRLTEAEKLALDKVIQGSGTGEGSWPRAPVTPDRSMEHAIAHVFDRESAVSEKQLLAEALRFGVGSVVPADLKKQLTGHGLIAADIDGRRVTTTEQVLAEEQAMVEFARDGRGRCDKLGQGNPHVFKRNLDAGQQEAVEQLLASRDRVLMLIGKAGVGKTTTLRELADALEERGQKLIAIAPSARASRGVLREKGFATADTVASLLRSEDMQQEVRGNVILVDEAGLAGTKALGQVFDLAQKQDARVLVVGDPQQHRGVPRGSVLKILQDHAGLEPVRLSKIRRQVDPAYREAVEALSEEGLTVKGFDRLDAQGFIQEIAEPDERYRRLAGDYADTLEAGHTALIVSPTHAEGRMASAAVREELRHRGKLGAEDRDFVRYESKGLTEAQRADAVQYQPGDMVQWHQHAPGFKSGDRVEVVVNKAGKVQVKDARGEIRVLPLEHGRRFELYRTASLPVAEGDRLRISHNGYTNDGKKHRLNNGDVVTVARFTAEGDIIDHRGWRIGKDFGHLAHGIVTSHASQGMDEDYCFVAQSAASLGATSAQQFYVSASRGKLGLRVYTDDKETLRKAVARSEQSGSATQVWQARQSEKDAAAREALHQRQRRRRYVDAMKSMRDKAARRLRQLAGDLRDRFRAGEDRQRELTHAQS